MGRTKFYIDPIELRRLYIEEKLDPQKIAALVGCTFATVRHRLIEHGIPLRSPAVARIRYARQPFAGSIEEKAYLYGFTVGDLNVYVPGKKSSATLVVRCHTTQKVQKDVFTYCFSSYGAITHSINARTGSISLTTYLDPNSFGFLLDKYNLLIPNWLTYDMAWPFIAGYNDAEGNVLLNQNRARFKIDTYDSHILHWLHTFLQKMGIRSKLRLIGMKGQLRSNGTYFNNNLWRLNINEALSLQSFINAVMPYTRHAKRKSDMLLCLENIKMRISRKTV
jgi:hypothetical protein